MKTRYISLAGVLCGVLLVASACAFRVLEPAGEATPEAAQQQTTTEQTTEGQPAATQPVASGADTSGTGPVAEPTATAEPAASSDTAGTSGTAAQPTATAEPAASSDTAGTSGTAAQPTAIAEPAASSDTAGASQAAGAEESKAYIPAFGQYSAEAGCRQIVLNSGMEEDTAWRFVGGKPARYATDAAHAGMRSILAGLTEGRPFHSYSDARQWISIPATAVTATLQMRWQPRTEEQADPLIERCTRGNCPTGDLSAGPLPASHDLQYVLAVRPDWSFEWLLRAKANAAQWQPLEFDLTRYAGRTVAIQFGVYNDPRGGLTSMFVDDVELWVCEKQ